MSKSQSGKNQHVVPHPDGWAVKAEGADRATRVTETQREAIEIARNIAKNQASERIVHGQSKLCMVRMVAFVRRTATAMTPILPRGKAE
ncbi:hypothetical protein XM38_039440 [Halomicronema hongdechloris C2206]|uniref:DUF2188 domain-containing protein n=1 Tax=Halomicronema hongdechloris C2206 TaxID=1641165 RepID=A0A1Z3HRN7_9CYAN|nr:DUF2188 domain-containing protein [Halomicronema hongdechloris]ASC72983.1 hypothetical protein XM38_039440 [Halomicronema hongdechloris C2206]